MVKYVYVVAPRSREQKKLYPKNLYNHPRPTLISHIFGFSMYMLQIVVSVGGDFSEGLYIWGLFQLILRLGRKKSMTYQRECVLPRFVIYLRQGLLTNTKISLFCIALFFYKVLIS